MTVENVDVADCEQGLCNSLFTAFENVHDPRKARGKRFELPALLSLVVIAVLAGCKNPTQIYHFALAQPKLLLKLGFHPPIRPRIKENKGLVRAPNEDTITYILDRLHPEQFVGAFARWTNAMIGCEKAVVAVDGKALCGSGDHILTAFVGKLRLAVWQKSVKDKENELSALNDSLTDLFEEYPGLWLLTGDAMFCQKKVAQQVVQARRHYLLQLKKNHETDYNIAEQRFEQLTQKTALAQSEPDKRGIHEDR